jgi:branched-chain amino acid transport system substrate-binding protein
MKRTKIAGGRPIAASFLALALVAGACAGDDSEAPPGLEDAGEEEEDTDVDSEEEGESEEAGGSDEAVEYDEVRLGILGQCEGPFGGFHEDTVAGVALALVNHAGATVASTDTALDGWEGAQVDGTTIELVGIGCGDDTPDTILGEVRQLVEQNDANVVIGPLSGDEGIAVAEYARQNPQVTFLSGIAGSQEPTLEVQAPNYFRFHGDGAIWNAGLGDILHNQEGWDTVAVIADDYSFGHTSTAGFVADFCAVGGEVTTRVFPPLGTTDYSSFIAQLPDPDEVDGYFWVVGGTGTQAALEAFVNAKGDLTGDQHAGNLFFNPGLAQALGTGHRRGVRRRLRYPARRRADAGDRGVPRQRGCHLGLAPDRDRGGEPADASAAAGFGFMYGYYSAGVALVEGLSATGGDPSPEPLQSALADLTVDLPYGPISLDENRSGIVDVFISQLVVDEETGEVVQETVALIPEVDQTFGGTFGTDTPAPSRDFPPCEERELPWEGNAIPVEDGVPQR